MCVWMGPRGYRKVGGSLLAPVCSLCLLGVGGSVEFEHQGSNKIVTI